ncbi:MAG: SufD family Fe-S cluster assembly protein [Acidimicrobiales bacterium]|nr:SufD family Fe-S cluster assembly protein [Acidimicrobiales bacterium]
MTLLFSPDRAAELGEDQQRRDAVERAASAGLPDTTSEVWRYSPIADLDLDALDIVTEPPSAELATPDHLAEALDGLSAAATVTVADGFVVSVQVADGWEAKGLQVEAVPIKRYEPADGSHLFDHLHAGFAPDGVLVKVADNVAITDPIVIRSHLNRGVAGFTSVKVHAGPGSEVTIFEYQSSDGDGLIVPMTQFHVEREATVNHAVVQDLDHQTWQIGRVVSTVGDHATLNSSLIAFGGKYARLRTDSDLAGRGAKGELVGAYFADGDQILDYRTFQQHIAPDTLSDLLFKGTVDDSAGSVYTGMIHIHPEGAGSNAFQTNRNIKLGDDAWAWSVPNLEIENNDVRCSHASTVSPVDPDQRFYLHSRGVAPTVADRLIVAGFFEEALKRVAVPAAAQMARSLIAAKLDERLARR